MSEVTVPDIGDFTDVPVIEVLVAVGDTVAKEDPLVVLESDKATMEVPSPADGTVAELLVGVGQTVSEGTPLLRLEGDGEPADTAPDAPADGDDAPATDAAPAADDAPAADSDERCDLVVVGSGPGGYSAAFRAADLGLDVILVERYETLGGVCLNVGCIPSKALLHVAKVISETEETAQHGVSFGAPEIDVDAIREWKDGVVGKLTGGLGQMAKGRKVRVLTGTAQFTGPHTLDVGDTSVGFASAIVAVGSTPVTLPDQPEDQRIVDSTGALALTDVPERLLVVGGGIIGLEMATVYDALGAKVTVVELMDGLIPGADRDLIKPLHKRLAGRYEAILLETKVTAIVPGDDGVEVTVEGPDGRDTQSFDRVLVAVGRRPNGAGQGLEAAGVEVGDRGFVEVDERMRTNVEHIYAIGDVVGEPMLAHKATHEAHVAAENAAGHDAVFDVRSIPSVAYTDPEVAWTGLTETAAKADGVDYEVQTMPWQGSGRALATGRSEGLTKLLVDPQSRRILGGGIVGVGAGELIAEVVLAIEMGALDADLSLTIHPHPTLSETVGFAAEMADGTITDMPNKKARRG